MKPSQDPNCQKYIDDPARTFYAGNWMTQEQIENARKRMREWKREQYQNDFAYWVKKQIRNRRRDRTNHLEA